MSLVKVGNSVNYLMHIPKNSNKRHVMERGGRPSEESLHCCCVRSCHLHNINSKFEFTQLHPNHCTPVALQFFETSIASLEQVHGVSGFISL